MNDDHIAVKIDGVLYVKLDDAKKLREEIERLRNALVLFLEWAEGQCPCADEGPDPCPRCGAAASGEDGCMAIEATFPLLVLDAAYDALEPATREKEDL